MQGLVGAPGHGFHWHLSDPLPFGSLEAALEYCWVLVECLFKSLLTALEVWKNEAGAWSRLCNPSLLSLWGLLGWPWRLLRAGPGESCGSLQLWQFSGESHQSDLTAARNSFDFESDSVQFIVSLSGAQRHEGHLWRAGSEDLGLQSARLRWRSLRHQKIKWKIAWAVHITRCLSVNHSMFPLTRFCPFQVKTIRKKQLLLMKMAPCPI